jgi:hypothetical protein
MSRIFISNYSIKTFRKFFCTLLQIRTRVDGLAKAKEIIFEDSMTGATLTGALEV